MAKISRSTFTQILIGQGISKLLGVVPGT